MTTQSQNTGTQGSKQKSGAGPMNEPNRETGREQERGNEQRSSQGASKSDANRDEEVNRPQGADWKGHQAPEKSAGSERERGLSGASNRSGDTQPR